MGPVSKAEAVGQEIRAIWAEPQVQQRRGASGDVSQQLFGLCMGGAGVGVERGPLQQA